MTPRRRDLLALTLDDLVVLGNRGLVKRAAQEVESGAATCAIDEDAAGGVTFRWSDGVECVLPAGKVVADARCTCPATTICRHVLRSVIAYQRAAEAAATEGGEAEGERPAAAALPGAARSRERENEGPGEREPVRAGDSAEEAGSEAMRARGPRSQVGRLPEPSPVRSEGARTGDAPGRTGATPTSAAPPDSMPASAVFTGARPAGAPSTDVWDPGAIADEQLAALFAPAALARARRALDEGHVVELVRGAKPSAIFQTLSVALRFLVPDDARYTHCDCAEPAPCAHVPMAVWCFRRLPAGARGGIVETNAAPLSAPNALAADAERALGDLAAEGISGGHAVLADRIRRLEERARAEGLAWPAEILAEIAEQCRAYGERDARFSPTRVAELFGELCARLDAARAMTGAVPQAYVRGSSADRATAVSSARLVGLGCEVAARRGVVEVAAYMQDVDSGMVVAVRKSSVEGAPAAAPGSNAGSLRSVGGAATGSPGAAGARGAAGASAGAGGEEPAPFWRLAAAPAVKGASFAALGAGQMLAKGGRRTSRREFVPGRSPASVSPQAFRWESLREPVRVESFAELAARLSAAPPAALRPRRIAEDLHVCAVAGAEAVGFSHVEQSLVARLEDAAGAVGLLAHPFAGRAREGFEVFAAELERRPEALRFVAGRARLERGTVVLAPISAVFEGAAGREIVQPWVDRVPPAAPGGAAGRGGSARAGSSGDRGEGASALGSVEPAVDAACEADGGGDLHATGDPLVEYLETLLDLLGELLLAGLGRANERTAAGWRDARERGEALGLSRLVRPVERLAVELERKRSVLRWDSGPAVAAALEVAALAALAARM